MASTQGYWNWNWSGPLMFLAEASQVVGGPLQPQQLVAERAGSPPIRSVQNRGPPLRVQVPAVKAQTSARRNGVEIQPAQHSMQSRFARGPRLSGRIRSYSVLRGACRTQRRHNVGWLERPYLRQRHPQAGLAKRPALCAQSLRGAR